MNELQQIVKEIQYRTGKNLEQIAQSIEYSRSYFNDQINKGDSPTIKQLLLTKYKKELEHFVRKGKKYSAVQEDEVSYGQSNQLLTVLVELVKRQNNILERQVVNVEDKVERIDINLIDALGRVDSLRFDISSVRTVVLESLSRLEGKKNGSLLREADNIKLSLLNSQKQQNKSADKGK